MNKLPLIWERIYPFVFGAVSLVGWLSFGHEIGAYCGLNGFAFDNIYNAIFGLISITTGFLATFYGTIQSITGGFIQAVRSTVAFNTFLIYIKHAIITGFICAICTIPYMIMVPVPIEQWSSKNVFVALWISLTVTALGMFLRVAVHLFSLFESRHHPKSPAG